MVCPQNGTAVLTGLTRRRFFTLSELLLRGTIVNRTYGARQNLPGIYLTIFTINIK